MNTDVNGYAAASGFGHSRLRVLVARSTKHESTTGVPVVPESEGSTKHEAQML
jgi:hypothetical protein